MIFILSLEVNKNISTNPHRGPEHTGIPNSLGSVCIPYVYLKEVNHETETCRNRVKMAPKRHGDKSNTEESK